MIYPGRLPDGSSRHGAIGGSPPSSSPPRRRHPQTAALERKRASLGRGTRNATQQKDGELSTCERGPSKWRKHRQPTGGDQPRRLLRPPVHAPRANLCAEGARRPRGVAPRLPRPAHLARHVDPLLGVAHPRHPGPLPRRRALGRARPLLRGPPAAGTQARGRGQPDGRGGHDGRGPGRGLGLCVARAARDGRSRGGRVLHFARSS